jgi:hypothetical protein
MAYLQKMLSQPNTWQQSLDDIVINTVRPNDKGANVFAFFSGTMACY